MKVGETKSLQLTINFEAGLVESYGSCRELVAARVHQQGRPQKSIAADMDLSPSALSRKLAQNPDDSMRLTVDDLERYIVSTRDRQPVFYLVEKYLMEGDTSELEKRIAELQAQLANKKGRR